MEWKSDRKKREVDRERSGGEALGTAGKKETRAAGCDGGRRGGADRSCRERATDRMDDRSAKGVCVSKCSVR